MRLIVVALVVLTGCATPKRVHYVVPEEGAQCASACEPEYKHCLDTQGPRFKSLCDGRLEECHAKCPGAYAEGHPPPPPPPSDPSEWLLWCMARADEGYRDCREALADGRSGFLYNLGYSGLNDAERARLQFRESRSDEDCKYNHQLARSNCDVALKAKLLKAQP